MKNIINILALVCVFLKLTNASLTVTPTENYFDIPEDGNFKIKIEVDINSNEELIDVFNEIECKVNGTQSLEKYIGRDTHIYCVRSCKFPQAETKIQVKRANALLKEYSIGKPVGTLDASKTTYVAYGSGFIDAGTESLITVTLYDVYNNTIKNSNLATYFDRVLCYTNSKNMTKTNSGSYISCSSQETTISGIYTKVLKIVENDGTVVDIAAIQYQVRGLTEISLEQSVIQFPSITYNLQSFKIKFLRFNDVYGNIIYGNADEFKLEILGQIGTYNLGHSYLKNNEYVKTMPYIQQQTIRLKICKGVSNCKTSSPFLHYGY